MGNNKIEIYDLNDNKVLNMYQWDVNQVLKVTNISDTNHVMIHFSGKSYPTAYVVSPTIIDEHTVTVPVPNILLQHADQITLYVYAETGEDAHKTTDVVKIPVVGRPVPSDYEYEENIEYISINLLNTEVDELKEAKSDWNQNDSSAIDYIKNKPFYSETVVSQELSVTDEQLTQYDNFYYYEKLDGRLNWRGGMEVLVDVTLGDTSNTSTVCPEENIVDGHMVCTFSESSSGFTIAFFDGVRLIGGMLTDAEFGDYFCVLTSVKFDEITFHSASVDKTYQIEDKYLPKNNTVIYSDEYHQVGTWIDGSAVYEKTYIGIIDDPEMPNITFGLEGQIGIVTGVDVVGCSYQNHRTDYAVFDSGATGNRLETYIYNGVVSITADISDDTVFPIKVYATVRSVEPAGDTIYLHNGSTGTDDALYGQEDYTLDLVEGQIYSYEVKQNGNVIESGGTTVTTGTGELSGYNILHSQDDVFVFVDKAKFNYNEDPVTISHSPTQSSWRYTGEDPSGIEITFNKEL